MSANLDRVLRQAIETTGLPGIAAMAATREGVIYAGAAGVRDIATGAAMQIDSVARLASMTKAVTSVAALLCVERGLLTLDDPINDVLPELAEPMVFERFGVDTRPILHPADTEITLRHLLTHTAGYGYDTWNQPLGHIQTSLGLQRIPTSADELRRVPLLFQPGSQWNYGINTDVVGRAVEVVTGQSLETFFQTEITGPLGMADTAFITGSEQETRRIAAMRRMPDDTLVPLDLPRPETMAYMAGGGGLHGTAQDYLTFLQALLAGVLLGPLMMGELIRPQTGAINVGPMISAVPEMSHDLSLYPEMELKWSLGFMVNSSPTAEGRSAGSLAWAGLFNTYYWLDLARGVCGVFVAQLLPFADPATLAAFQAFETAVYTEIG